MTIFRRRPFNRTLLVGLMFLAIAGTTKLVIERHSTMPEGPRDGLIGLLFGVAIGCMLLGVWRMGRAGRVDLPGGGA